MAGGKKTPGRPSIYGLFDQDGRLRYIGKADDPQRRLASHLRDSRRRHTPVCCWIRKHGLPEMRVLIRDSEDWRQDERRLIAEARARGDILLNLADGGDQPGTNPAQLSRNGIALVQRLRSDPRAARLRLLKARLMTAIRLGQVRPETVAKLRELGQRDPARFACFAHVGLAKVGGSSEHA